jgi:hypothetical protein
MIQLHRKLAQFSLTRSVLCIVCAFITNAAMASYWCNSYGFGIPTERFAQCANGVATPIWISVIPFVMLAIAVYPLACKLVPFERDTD